MDLSMEQKDLFGFLPRNWDIRFDGGHISPIENYDAVEQWVIKYTNVDGFLYPPMSKIVRVDLATMQQLEEMPKTEKPALLHQIEPSHEIILFEQMDKAAFRKGPGGFLINLLAYIFGTRLQFHDWYFDRRVPIETTHNIGFTREILEDFVSHSYKKWQSWKSGQKNLFFNILYMHSRSPSYEWDWERFTMEYMVFDCCFKLAIDLGIIKMRREKIPHKDRIIIICVEFKIPSEQELIKDIVILRNAMFHEALWSYSNPGLSKQYSMSNQLYEYHLRRLNQRIIPCLLDYRTPYVNTKWWCLSPTLFEKPHC